MKKYIVLIICTCFFPISTCAKNEPKHIIDIKPFENCYGIYISGQKIGYSCERLDIDLKEKKVYNLSTETKMQFAAFGVPIETEIQSRALIDNELNPLENEFIMSGATGQTRTVGKKHSAVWQVSRYAGDEKISERSYPYKDIKLSEAIDIELMSIPLSVGYEKELFVFNSEIGDTTTMKIKVLEEKVLNWLDKKTQCFRVENSSLGVTIMSWVTKDGVMIESTAAMGIRMVLEAKSIALDMTPKEEPLDIIQWTSIPFDEDLDEVDKLNSYTFLIDGINPDVFALSGTNRTVKIISDTSFVLTVEKTCIPDSVNPGLDEKNLASTPDIQSDAVDIRDIVLSRVKDSDPALKKIDVLMEWMQGNINKKITFSIPSALEVLKIKQGDCGEFSVLFAALLRAAGIPTKVVAGVVYFNKTFFYHAWNEVLLDGIWYPVDSSMNQINPDVTHIKLIEGETSNQLKIADVVRKIKIKKYNPN